MSKRMMAQTILEYTVILGLVVTALVVMQVYMKRGIQAAIKITADTLGNQAEGLTKLDPRRGIAMGSLSDSDSESSYTTKESLGSQNLEIDEFSNQQVNSIYEMIME